MKKEWEWGTTFQPWHPFRGAGTRSVTERSSPYSTKFLYTVNSTHIFNRDYSVAQG